MRQFRLCGISRYIFMYWLENINTDELSKDQINVINFNKKFFSEWLITTSGYYDKSIKGNWRGKEEKNIINNIIVSGKEIMNSENFNKFYRELYYITFSKKSHIVIFPFMFNLLNNRDLFISEIEIFKKYIDKSLEIPLNVQEGPYRSGEPNKRIIYGGGIMNSINFFKICENKNILIVNLFADVLRDHYNSGKITEFYKKYYNLNNFSIINNIYSLEISYNFGNGINETQNNNFFETLEVIKNKIDNFKEHYDICIISAGANTAFIADHMDKKNKDYMCFGRELAEIFCIVFGKNNSKYFTEGSKKYGEKYFCTIPKKYRLKNYQYVENGCYW